MTRPDDMETASARDDPAEDHILEAGSGTDSVARDRDQTIGIGQLAESEAASSLSIGEPLDVRYLSGAYLTETDDWHEGRADWKAEQVARMLAKHRIEPESICDIGCGTGGVLDSLREIMPNPPQMVGYEVASQAVDLAPKDRRERIELVNGSHDTDKRRFDLLLALDVLEHLEDYYGFLRAIRAKAPIAMFHIPIDTAVTTVLRPGPAIQAVHSVGHIQHFIPALALEALRYAGYTIVDYEYTVTAQRLRPKSLRGWLGKAARLSLARVNVDLAARLVAGFSLLVLAETGSREE